MDRIFILLLLVSCILLGINVIVSPSLVLLLMCIMVSLFFLQNFELALFFFCLSFICSEFFQGQGFFNYESIRNIFFAILCISFLISGQRNMVVKWSSVSKLLIALLVYEIVQIAIFPDAVIRTSLKTAASFLIFKIPIYFIIVFYCTNRREKAPSLINILLFVAALESLLAIFQQISPAFFITRAECEYSTQRGYLGYIFSYFSRWVTNSRGTFDHFNILGNFLALFTPLPFALALNKKNNTITSWIYSVIFLLIFSGVVFSYSRGSLLGVIVAIAIMICLVIKRKKILLLALFILIPVGFVFYAGMRSFILDYFTSTENLMQPDTGRFSMWLITWKLIIKEPFHFFLGWGGYGAASYDYFVDLFGFPPPEHNAFLGFWVRRGLLGILILIGILVIGVRHAWLNFKLSGDENNRAISFGIMGALIAFLISQIFDHKLLVSNWAFSFLFIFLGISEGLFLSEKK